MSKPGAGLALLLALGVARASTPAVPDPAGGTPAHLEETAAIKLYQDKNYPAAWTALEKITAAHPADAQASYYLGMALRHRRDDRALDDAVSWLEKAVALAPDNARYLADYGGTCLQLAGKRQSYRFATRGRDALEKSLGMDPSNLHAREGLMLFYARAPWPLGDQDRARAEAKEILRRAPRNPAALQVMAKLS